MKAMNKTYVSILSACFYLVAYCELKETFYMVIVETVV